MPQTEQLCTFSLDGHFFGVPVRQVQEVIRYQEMTQLRLVPQVVRGLIKAAVGAMGTISEVIHQINAISNTMATAVEEQNATTNEMARNISEAAHGGGEISSNISGVAEAAQSRRQVMPPVRSEGGDGKNFRTRDMQPFRILIVDDSAVSRNVLSSMLASDPGIVVAGTAGNGLQALSRIPEVKPDLVTLDIEMPGMDGLETLVEIRKLYPTLPVIMFSSLTERGATVTLDALARGASDYVAKPSQERADVSRERVREELLRKIKSLCSVRVPQRRPRPRPTAVPLTTRASARIDVVAIGTSTGGPNALTALMPQLPADFPVPILIVQHMPPLFTRLLAERLNTLTWLEVQEGKAGQELRRGQVWIAPGDHHMTVVRKGMEFVLSLNRDPLENSCRPAVDVLFRSVAQAYGGNALAVVLSGMGTDGTRGSAEIRAAGGEVIVQDEASAVVWGMPGSVVAANLADCICPLDGLGAEIVRRVSMRRVLAMAASPCRT